MKIIKPGKSPGERIYQGTCRNCSCQIEFAYNEAEFVADQRDGDFLRINCPTCMTFINVAVKR